jgi:general secretion pathway protein F
MPTFRYRAYGARGEFREGSIDAVTEDAAGDMLWAQGLTPFQMRLADQSAKPWWQRELFSGHRSLASDLASFTREFATLNTAEIPLDDSLRILSEQATSARTRALASSLLADVLNGLPLSDAMRRQPQTFSADYVSVVRAGEIGGTVGQVLEELADLLERRLELKGKIQSALVYPMILLALSILSLAVIIGVLVPSIAPIFADGAKPLPSFIRFLMTVQSRWLEILTGLIVTAAVTVAAITTALKRPKARLAFDHWKVRLPILGAFIRQHETARFARTLSTLLKAGVPLLQAATSARTVVGNRHLGAGLDVAIDAIREGAALHRALQDATTLPPIALRMISVGEEARKLDRMLWRVAVTLEQQTQHSIDRFMAALTPLLTIIIASLVGGLIMAVMGAISNISELVVR